MSMKEQIKELWECCFADSQAFIEMYFRLRYHDDINIAIIEDGKPVSALQMIPYPMTFFDKMWQTAYVSGACTLPEYRAKGIMRQLLTNAYREMYIKGIELTTLIPAEPWLFNYYQSMGYATVFNYAKQNIASPLNEASSQIDVQKSVQFDKVVYDYFNQKQQVRNCAIQHSEEDFKVILADLSLVQSGIYIAKIENQIIGLAIAYDRDSFIEINELMIEDEKCKNALIQAIARDYNGKKLMQYLRATEESSYPLGMARIIHAKKVLQDYASTFPEKEWRIHLIDKQISENNQYFHLSKGSCSIINSPSDDTYQTMDISTLSQELLSPFSPYMNLMLN